MPANGAEQRARRSRGQRLFIVFNTLCVVAALVTAGALVYLEGQLGQLQRVELGSVLDDVPGGRGSGTPLNYLLVGADSAEGLSADDPIQIGRNQVSGLRSDTIMVLRLEPNSNRASLLSIPRDLWVPIAGTGSSRKINNAINNSGGPEVLIRTVEDYFKFPIHHYLQLDFAGFRELVDAIDGVPIYFSTPVRDRNTGLRVEEPGCHVLDPTQALAFARSREYEVFSDGEWEPDNSSDYGRVNRQQFFIQRALERAIAKGARNPATLRRLLELGIDNVTVDDQLKPEDMLRIGLRFRNFNPENLVKYTLPADRAFHGGADALDLRVAEAQPILEVFRGEKASEELSPSAVRVQVLNGSGRRNEAAQTSLALGEVGFVVGPTGDEAGAEATLVRYAPGQEAAAQLAARYLRAPATLEASNEVVDADVVVITGADFAGVLDAPKPAEEVPTTSAPSTSSTQSTSPTTTAPDDTSQTTSTTLGGAVPGDPPAGVDCG